MKLSSLAVPALSFLLAGTVTAAGSSTLTLASKPILTRAIAQHMAETCINRQVESEGPPVDVAIYGRAGNPLLYIKMDGTTSGTAATVMSKAESAARFGVATVEVGNWVKGSPGVGHVPDLLGVQGGLPIYTPEGDLLGGIGVSGAPPAEDEACAQAAIDAASKHWK